MWLHQVVIELPACSLRPRLAGRASPAATPQHASKTIRAYMHRVIVHYSTCGLLREEHLSGSLSVMLRLPPGRRCEAIRKWAANPAKRHHADCTTYVSPASWRPRTEWFGWRVWPGQ